jgi:hypothetical protein
MKKVGSPEGLVFLDLIYDNKEKENDLFIF